MLIQEQKSREVMSGSEEPVDIQPDIDAGLLGLEAESNGHMHMYALFILCLPENLGGQYQIPYTPDISDETGAIVRRRMKI